MRFKTLKYIFLFLFLVTPTTLFASEKIKVVTSLSLLKEFAEKIGGKKITDPEQEVRIEPGKSYRLKIGKRRFAMVSYKG